MFISRKGLSDIVTNVLIILLVLVAVGIIWAFVRPTINQGAGQLQGQNDCLTIQVDAVSCVKQAGGVNNYTVSYKRAAGGADDKIQSMKFIFKDASGTTKVLESTAALPNQLEAKTASEQFPGFTASTFDVAVVVKTDDPAGRTCPERAAPVNCA